ncbi:c-type cytochrome [Pendulispora rubella]|uniref:C-type cytochrome n=1 Tax=Pendulispora rubella TaxID=2741070 RepID=A0ABZ2L6M8_9BACT
MARALRQGAGLAANEDVEALARLTPDEIVNHFMDDPRFVDTVFDFNQYFLGLKQSDLKLPDGNWNPEAIISRRALHSAFEFKKGKNYLSLLSFEQPQYAFRPKPAPAASGTPEMSQSDLLRYHLNVALEDADELLAHLEAGKDWKAFCQKLDSSELFYFSYKLFNDDDNEEFPIAAELGHVMPLFWACGWPESFSTDARAEVRKLRQYAIELHDYAQELLAKSQPSGRLDDLTEVNLERFHADHLAKNLDHIAFWDPNENSSTNQNRRRAAYVLDRFFCDDLRPIDAALPSTHAGDRHASDPACKSCHYKLDPMAGFFKERGQLGLNLQGETNFIFDDRVVQNREVYQSQWKGSGERPWNIGYIRSSTDPALNSYGESLEDLFHIIEEAPEVKACLTRRTFEYFNGEQQLVDPGYLAGVTNSFIDESKGNSSIAFRNLVRRVLTSHTFRTSHPRSDECYDVPADDGVDVGARPPCSVAFILQKNCATCHSGPGSQGGLDLTTWRADEQTFPHRGPDGTPRPARETFTRMLDRIRTSDPARQMPAGRSMPAKEREDLYLWLTERLAGGAP